MRAEIVKTLLEARVTAIVRGIPAEALVKTADALLEGGVRCIEVTFDTPGAAEMIRTLKGKYAGRMLVGAGTVLDTETCRTAILAGADFILSPTLNTEVIRMCNRYGRAAVPGVMTPTEILTALEAGADIVKVFPAGALGRQGSAQAGVHHGRRRSEPGKHGGSVPRGRVLRGRGLQSGEQSADSKRQL